MREQADHFYRTEREISRSDTPYKNRKVDLNQLYHYRGYGLNIGSQIELPWHVESKHNDPDISIRNGKVPEALESATETRGYFQVANGICLLNVQGVSRCLISEGGREVLFAAEGNNRQSIIYILDSILAVCLHLRDVLALNASAIATREGAVVFAGSAGIGKSTVVAALCDMGYPLVADGIVAVRKNDVSRPRVFCGFPQIRLWTRSINTLQGIWSKNIQMQIRPELESFLVSVPYFHGKDIPLHAVYVLVSKNLEKIDTKPLAPVRAVARLIDLACRAHLLQGLGKGSGHFHNVTAIARYSTVECLSLPVINCPPATLAEQISVRLPPPA
ncbi:MAG: hypothetical protein OXF73_03160 [Gammaproteobacteria bacterium]|nr:hypothetical protein [Gammaproteobacteria bacterium]MCY4228535.1 hypothetical protein [Gammaproteobacteria bacterium]